MKDFINHASLLLIMTACIAIAYLSGHSNGKRQAREEFKPDTLTFVDTLHYYLPRTKDSVIIRFETIRVPSKPGSSQEPEESQEPEDSVEVSIPIEQKVYQEDDYTAYVSGYRPSLDSLIFTSRTTNICQPPPAKRKRWSFGVQAGFGMTPKGLQPYIGIGATYKFK